MFSQNLMHFTCFWFVFVCLFVSPLENRITWKGETSSPHSTMGLTWYGMQVSSSNSDGLRISLCKNPELLGLHLFQALRLLHGEPGPLFSWSPRAVSLKDAPKEVSAGADPKATAVTTCKHLLSLSGKWLHVVSLSTQMEVVLVHTHFLWSKPENQKSVHHGHMVKKSYMSKPLHNL